MEFVKTTIEGPVATVTISRGDGINALSIQTLEELRDTARRLQDIPDLLAVVIHGDGAFSAGADLKDDGPFKQERTALELRHFLKLGPDMCRAWEEVEAVTIAAIERYCVGGASALACALDYRVMAEDAIMRLPEIQLGINMSWHTIPRLVAQIGPARTKQYVILGEPVPAAQALSFGLCEEVVPKGETLAAAQAYAAKVAALPPLPVRMTKAAVNAVANALAFATTHMDRDQYMLTLTTEDFREAIAAGLSKRKPRYTGR